MSATRKQGELESQTRDAPTSRKIPRSHAPLQAMLRGAGNNAVRGLVQARLRVGSVADPLEAEADRAAASFGGECCAGKSTEETCDECSVRRKEHPGAMSSQPVARDSVVSHSLVPTQRSESSSPQEAPADVDRALHAFGTPLDAQTRATMESHFDSDLGDVRVHSGGDASSSADSIGAYAYTSGRDIVFSGGAYQPHTSDGRRLLAHELAHVLQQRGRSDRTIRREDKKKPPPSAPVDDPCAVSATSLTNAELVGIFSRTLLYVKSHKKGEDALWYDHGNLLRRLATERRSRMRMGHVWLGDESLTAMPSALYELRSGLGRAIEVLPADVKKEAGAPGGDGKASVMTPGQFNGYLERHRIQSVDMADYFAKQDPSAPLNPLTYVLPEPEKPKRGPWDPTFRPQDFSTMFLNPMGGDMDDPYAAMGIGGAGWGTIGVNAFGGYLSPFSQFASGHASKSMYRGNANPATLSVKQQSGGEVKWRGVMPEITTGRGTWADVARYTDLNQVQANFEVFDFRNRGTGDLVSVTHTLPDRQGNTSFRGYDEKYLKAIGMEEPAKFNTSLTRLNQEFGTNLQVIDANEKTYLAVNDDHVDAFRSRIVNDIGANPAKYATLLDALLRKEPVSFTAADGTRTVLRNWNDFQNARATNAIDASTFNSTITRLASKAGDRVIGSGITTTEIQVLQQFRRQNWAVTPDVWSKTVAPELTDAMKKGTIDPVTGQAKPGYGSLMKSSAKGGAKMGLGFTAVTDAVRFGMNPEEHPDMWREGIIDLGLGAAGSASSAMVESGVAAYTSNALIGQTGRSAALLRVLGRGGGGLLGGLAAPVVTMGALMLDSEEHSRLEYYGAMGRSGASAGVGGLAGALATGTYFAIAGSEFPVVGNAIGFVVGFGGALAFDAIWGEDIDKGIREYGGELGCVDKAVPK